ncbi:MAG: hypothetical protein AAGF89_01670, partial [Bacteroidota bacterium]
MNEKSNKLISLLASLDRSQQRGCRKLIQSPWFSSNKDLLAFYDEIIKRMDRGKSLDKRQIWAAVLGKTKAFNDVRFRKYTSDLFKLIKEFLTQEALEQEPELKNYLYLAALEKQNPDKLIRGVERNWTSFADSQQDADYNQFLYRHLLERRKRSLLNYEHRPYDRGNVEEISASLDIYYIVVKLHSAIDAQSRRQTEQHQYDLKLVPEIVKFLDTTKTYLDYTPVAIYYYMYTMLSPSTADAESAYYHYKDVILKHADDLPTEQISG